MGEYRLLAARRAYRGGATRPGNIIFREVIHIHERVRSYMQNKLAIVAVFACIFPYFPVCSRPFPFFVKSAQEKCSH